MQPVNFMLKASIFTLLHYKVVSLVRIYAVCDCMPVDHIFHSLLDRGLNRGPMDRIGKSIARRDLFP